jgi:hypothetical protein
MKSASTRVRRIGNRNRYPSRNEFIGPYPFVSIEPPSRIDKDAKEARNRRIFEMWMACHTDAKIDFRGDNKWPELRKSERDDIAAAAAPSRVSRPKGRYKNARFQYPDAICGYRGARNGCNL